MQDIRWQQRLENFESAFLILKGAVDLSATRPLSDLENQGLIQSFEFTHELAWNVLKDYLAFQGTVEISGSRDAVREAFARGIIKDGHQWMNMIQSRNMTTHTYNKKVSNEITQKIREVYCHEFEELIKTMRKFKAEYDKK